MNTTLINICLGIDLFIIIYLIISAVSESFRYNSFPCAMTCFFFSDRKKYHAYRNIALEHNVTVFSTRREYLEMCAKSDFYSNNIIKGYCLVPDSDNEEMFSLYKENKLIIPCDYECVINKILEIIK